MEWWLSPGRSGRAVVGEERGEAGVLLGAGGAAAEVRGHAGHGALGVGPGELEVDVAVQLVEADLAGDLRLPGAEQAVQHGGGWRVVHRVSSTGAVAVVS